VVLKKALAADLAERGFGVYKPEGAYTKADTAELAGIRTNGPDMPTTFDRALVLTTLLPFEDGNRANRVTPVQLTDRLPGGRTDAENRFEALRDAYHGRRQVTLGPLTFREIRLARALIVSADTQGRVGSFITFDFYGRQVV
jgi:hypothetical protein